MATNATSDSVGIAVTTVVIAVALLFAGFGSAVLALVVADVEIETPLGSPDAAGSAAATIVKGALAPLGIVAAPHAIVPVAPIAGVVHVHPAGDAAEEKRSAASSTTERLGLAASLGPPFATTT